MRTLALCAAAFALLACKAAKPPELPSDPKTLAWRSAAPVADSLAQKIAGDAAARSRAHKAWSEAGHVMTADGAPGDGKAKFVVGDKKLYLGEYEPTPGKFTQVDAKDDAIMAYAEGLGTMESLARWARDGATFDVQLGAQKGQVTANGYDEAAQKLLADLQAKGGAPSDADALEKERARIEAKYADRK